MLKKVVILCIQRYIKAQVKKMGKIFSYKQISGLRIAFYAFFLIGLSVFNSCKKDTDSKMPEVKITSPSSGSIFNVYDTIIVGGSASDENKLVEVAIVLLDKSMTPVLRGISVAVSSNSISFTRKYVLYDIHLASGLYYIKVTASDGLNVKNVYRDVYVKAAPKERKSIYVLTAGNGKTDIHTMDTLSATTYRFSLAGDYSGSAISSWQQQLYVCGKYNGKFNSISLSENTITWSISPLITSSPFFSGVYSDELDSYISYHSNGKVSSFDFMGVHKKLFVSASENAHPQKCFRLKDYLLMEELDQTLSHRKLVTFYLSTGHPMQEMTLTQEVTEFFKKDETNVFIFGNNQGQGKIELFEVLKNHSWEPYSNFPSGAILSVAQIDEISYLIAHENNTVYKYQYGGFGLIPLINNFRADCLAFDYLNSEIIVSQNTIVKRYSYPGAQLMQTISAPDSVMAIHVLYNK